MPPTTPLPPHLVPLLTPPPCSLTLLTAALGASANWLVLRFVWAALLGDGGGGGDGDGGGVAGCAPVVLVSFVRDAAFWRVEGRRLGLDFAKLVAQGRLVVVDGLVGLFGGGQAQRQADGKREAGSVVLPDGALGAVELVLRRVIAEALPSGAVAEMGVLLAIDGIDAMMAATGAEAADVLDLVAELREHVHAVVVTVSADLPLLKVGTPLETGHLALVTSLAHQAEAVASLRALDTGAAADISGVIRITRGGGLEKVKVGERELLYFVGGDGGVRVFERGAY